MEARARDHSVLTSESPGTQRRGVFTLAHLSDPHLTTLDDVSTRELLNKRLLGYLAWRRRRRHEHADGVLAALLRDLAALAPEHTAITGDLTHIGTPAECRQARRWLSALGPPDAVTVVPGNHDTYTTAAWDETLGLWSPYMCSDRRQRMAAEDFPSVRRRGPVALIGVNTARPTAPLLATGRVGHQQLERLRTALSVTRQQGLCRIVLLHHPVAPNAVSRRKALDDAGALRELLRESGAEMILHGHGHHVARHSIKGPAGRRIPVFSAPSASALGQGSNDKGGYLSFRIRHEGSPRESAPAAPVWRIDVAVRRYDPLRDQFRHAARHSLEIPAGPLPVAVSY